VSAKGAGSDTGAGADATMGVAIEAFRAAGRALFSLGLVRGTEGNLSVSDGRTITITRAGSRLDALTGSDVLRGPLEDPPSGASSDLAVHRRLYGERGPGAVAHGHPPGSVPEDGGRPGEHGVYAFGTTLEAAVAEAVRAARGLPS
jgi:ribulose-5-phosphate 4-epimerase/fuculose-1-phosphate aldolase